MEPLNLSGADLKGFEPIPAAKYEAHVTDMEVVYTKNESGEGKMPAGTPGYNVRFTVDGGEYDERHVWNNYWMPTKEYEESGDEGKKKAATMKGILARFLIALGYSEEEVTGGSFSIDPDDIVGRKCTIIVGIRRSDEYGDRNIIKNVKKLETLSESGIL
jgi:hypothetical protein